MNVREDAHKLVLFDTEYRGFRLRGRYLKDSSYAYYYIQRDGKYYLSGRCMAYKIYNIAAHFTDMVEREMSTASFRLALSPLPGMLIVPRSRQAGGAS